MERFTLITSPLTFKQFKSIFDAIKDFMLTEFTIFGFDLSFYTIFIYSVVGTLVLTLIVKLILSIQLE